MDELEAVRARSAQKVDALRELLRGFGSALIAFSGGVDSTFVLAMAHRELGERAVALTALSASMAPEEQEDAKSLVERIGARWLPVASRELADPRYAANPVNRCYFCKSELYGICIKERAAQGLAVILDGFNADDKRDFRPGHQAAQEGGVRSPLAEVGLTKEEIRAWSAELGLPTWDKPQLACLASRIPHGVPVTEERLSQVARAESAIRRLGLRSFRVRHHGDVARIEVSEEEQQRLLSSELRQRLATEVKSAGYRFVALDLEPFRSGRLNAVETGLVTQGEAEKEAIPRSRN